MPAVAHAASGLSAPPSPSREVRSDAPFGNAAASPRNADRGDSRGSDLPYRSRCSSGRAGRPIGSGWEAVRPRDARVSSGSRSAPRRQRWGRVERVASSSERECSVERDARQRRRARAPSATLRRWSVGGAGASVRNCFGSPPRRRSAGGRSSSTTGTATSSSAWRASGGMVNESTGADLGSVAASTPAQRARVRKVL